MSRKISTSSFQGFSVFQPALGNSLQWLPALGSYELEEMIHSFLPGPASIQDKRAHISMDFFEYSRQTGETFKFYPVYTGSFASATTDSPASSSAMQDSGYGSSFNASPVVSDMSPWTPSLSASTPASTSSDSRTKSRPGQSQRTTSASSRQPLDFSNHPGMRILTKDGRDITNSASRGCKSKEQRDHAHLMRIIKACDACRRKKIRCDPSHKKRTSSQAQPSRPDSKQTKKATVAIHESPGQDFSFATPYSTDSTPSFDTEVTPAGSFDGLNENSDDFWQQFVHFDGQGVSIPGEHDFFLDPAGYVVSSYGSSSASPSQSFLPSTPGLPDNHGVLPDLAVQEPALPYLNPGDSYGTNYQDFNLYSPSPTSDLLDEEPQFVRKSHRKGHTSKQDNLLESSLQQAPHEPPNIDGYLYLHDGQGHQHGDLLETNVSDWSHVNVNGSRAQNAGDSVNDMHEIIPTTSDPGKDALVAPGGQPRLQPSPSLGTDWVPTRTSSGGLVPVQSLEAGVQTPALAVAARYPTALVPSVQSDSASAVINGRLYTSRVVDTYGSLPTVSQVRRVRAEIPLAGLAQAGGSRPAQMAGEQSSAGQSGGVNWGIFAPALQQAASLSLRRGLFTRSAFISEPNGCADVVARDRVPSSLLSGADWHEHGASEGINGEAVRTGLREAPRAPYVPSASASMAVPNACESGVLASSVLPPPPRQGVPDVPSEGCLSPTITLDHFVNFGLVSCLLALLVRWASLGWQLELLFALAFTVSSRLCPSHERTMDRFRSAATKQAGVLRRCFPRDSIVVVD
ncbi:hypothetical protein CONLIGDRAFT_642743 [Coniochaeta ligniaria NRRL 30616]|uniref:Zn(2)-C6 fungal-type domain-containing protein n=1 Tax=Coniochaeta ligniaria NRRL 30616 TaxID=1408157 RepID=A0A1J7ISQ8_9PEZI|nr:hypothetical protein CONLIGDRAFT_642743 [Coniochaeta ligniaria NRRL 30616]